MMRLVAIILPLLLFVLCGCHAIVSNRLQYVQSVTLYENGDSYAIPRKDHAFNRIVKQSEKMINKPLAQYQTQVSSKEELVRNTSQSVMIELEKPITIKIKEENNSKVGETTVNALWISLDPERKILATFNDFEPCFYNGKKNCFADLQKTASIYLQKER